LKKLGAFMDVSRVLLHLAVSSAFVMACAAKGDALDEWHWRSPLPQGNDLRAIVYADGVFVAVGDALTILRSADGVVLDKPRLQSSVSPK
jgi:hypothetical protein